jgi:hypothetical protein
MLVHVLYLIVGAALGFLGCSLFLIAGDGRRDRPVGFCELCRENIYTSFTEHHDLVHRRIGEEFAGRAM